MRSAQAELAISSSVRVQERIEGTDSSRRGRRTVLEPQKLRQVLRCFQPSSPEAVQDLRFPTTVKLQTREDAYCLSTASALYLIINMRFSPLIEGDHLAAIEFETFTNFKGRHTRGTQSSSS